MPVKIVAILPKGKLNPASAQAEMTAYLRAFAEEIKDRMSVYPAERPWSSRPPRSGPRAGGRRTGAYGEGWRNASVSLSAASVTVVNDAVPYATVVGGSRTRSPGQSRRLANRGWKSISDVGPAAARLHLPSFAKKIWG